MATQPLSWRVHLGAHKTATTHLQDTLLSGRDALDRNGLLLVPRERLLIAGLIRYLRFGEFRRKALSELFLGQSTDMCMRRRLLKNRRAHDQVLISEERILGRATDLLDGFYPDLETYLNTIAKIVGDDPITVFLSIRNQADVLPSAYSQALRTHNRPKPFDEIVEGWLQSPPRWTALVERLQQALPEASIKVWTFEEYTANPSRIIAALTGKDELQFADLSRPDRTRRLSAEAVSELEKVQPLDLDEDEKHSATAEAAQISGQSFDPLSEQQKAELTAVYEKDVADLPASCRLSPQKH